MKSFSSQFIVTIMGKRHAKIEEILQNRFGINEQLSVEIGQKWQN